ncbi:MAG: transporter [Proteobacteria bacterium]|nr:transporter [Pseudomonadota bacterium]
MKLMNSPLPSALLPLALTLVLNGCAIGPDYLRTEIQIPPSYREAAGWKTAQPADTQTASAWWERYGDPLLNDLAQQVAISNQNVVAAAAQYRQAEALLAGARAAWFPSLGAGLATTRSQGVSSATSTTVNPARTIDRLSLNSSWEVDLWGRISRSVESSASALEANAADLAAAKLSAQAALVQSYLQLRVNDAQQGLLTRTIAAYRRSHQITVNRKEAGIATAADVAQAEAQLKTTEAQAIDLGIQRAQLEHAIALLIGKLPSEFSLLAGESVPSLPEVPLVLPSELLERRPDIAAAERRMASANAQIGVAQAAFFPSLSISASGGYQHTSFSDLIMLPHRFWSLGPALALSIFDGGSRLALRDQAMASYDRSVASYRQTVLTAFQEVEDNLAVLRILKQEKEVQAAATRAAGDFQRLTNNQYMAGTVSFLNVATAQAAALSAERSSLDILNRQLAASVGLFKALGGSDWQDNASKPAAKLATVP